MNIYKIFNDITLYIEDNLDKEIDYEVIARMLTTNVYTMQRIFSILTGIPIGEYIRKRKLSCAAYDLVSSGAKVIDIAIKYGYESATSFSRAFFAFHGIKPSEVKKCKRFKEYPRIIYEEKEMPLGDVDYEVVTLGELRLYEVSVKTNTKNIKRDAPKFFMECVKKYSEDIKYAMVSYEDSERTNCSKYSVLYEKNYGDFLSVVIPAHKWIKFKCLTNDYHDIQKMVTDFYMRILPSLKYTLSDLPELEYYYGDNVDFLVPIE